MFKFVCQIPEEERPLVWLHCAVACNYKVSVDALRCTEETPITLAVVPPHMSGAVCVRDPCLQLKL